MNDEQLNLLNQTNEVDRRAFLKGASMSTLMMMMGGTVLVPARQAPTASKASMRVTSLSEPSSIFAVPGMIEPL